MIATIKGLSSRGSMPERKRNHHHVYSFLVFLLIILIPYVSANLNPYEILGVRRDASQDQIKQAYRELARKLHPDKSSEDEAGKKFIELNKAFNILKDPAKRSRFDQYGETEESRHSRGYHAQHHQNRRTREYWTHNGFRTFTFFSSSDSGLRRKSITTRQYYNEYLNESKSRPFLIFFFSDFCPSCNMIEPTWTKIIDELGKHNIGSFTLNVHQEPRLAQEIGVSSIPSFACLFNGRVTMYQQSELSLKSIVRFIRSLLPDGLAPLLKTEEEQDRFVTIGPQFNRLSAIIIHNENDLKLRYLLMANELQSHYRFSHVSTKLSQHSRLFKTHNIEFGLSPNHQVQVLVFDEDITRTRLNFIVRSDHDIISLKKQLLNWPYLQLPKLSSQERFDDLCLHSITKEADRSRNKLCVILFALDTPSYSSSRKLLIDFINMNNWAQRDRVVFAFLDPFKQSDFVQSLLSETSNTRPAFIKDDVLSSIIIITRHSQHNRKAHHQWLNARWDPNNIDEFDRAKLELQLLIESYNRNEYYPKEKLALSLLIDEEGPGLLGKIFMRMTNYVSRLYHYIIHRESLVPVIVLALCALVACMFMYQVPNLKQPQSTYIYDVNETPTKQQYNNLNRESPNHKSTSNSNYSYRDDLKMLELKAETYNGMVRLLKPGYRSIILLCDVETREKLLAEFRKAVWPYRKNKTLLFGYLCLDKNLEWYKTLLEGVLGVADLHVEKKKCIGTVLSLNGFKRYFRVYHAKHHEIDYYDDETDNDGSFLGFNEDDPIDIESGDVQEACQMNSSKDTIYTIDNLLEKLPIWLDKMFDGLTKRYFIDIWPENIK